jgi:hypothetical protein
MADLFFNSFHYATTLVPFEVTMMIMHIIASDNQGSVLGSPGQPLREVSSVSTVLRAAYKQIRYRARNGIFTLQSREHHRLHPNRMTRQKSARFSSLFHCWARSAGSTRESAKQGVASRDHFHTY